MYHDNGKRYTLADDSIGFLSFFWPGMVGVIDGMVAMIGIEGKEGRNDIHKIWSFEKGNDRIEVPLVAVLPW